jgi:glutathione S-transferase
MQSALILHQYELSPFSEKIRRILAYKRLPWTAVRAPAVMPKPELIALTGGYRKIPVLQVENHVYIDTSLIARQLERICPSPSLYTPAIAESLAEWADTRLFEATLPHLARPSRLDDLLRFMSEHELTTFAEDRRAMRVDAPRSAETSKSQLAHLRVYLQRLEASLAQSPYLFGNAPSIADFSVHHSLWLVSRLKPEALAETPHTLAFVERISAFPDAAIATISGDEALAISQRGGEHWQPPAAWQDPTGFAGGQSVTVRAADYGRDPVQGKLVYADDGEVVLQRQDARAGSVLLHFPRRGFEVAAS